MLIKYKYKQTNAKLTLINYKTLYNTNIFCIFAENMRNEDEKEKKIYITI